MIAHTSNPGSLEVRHKDCEFQAAWAIKSKTGF